MTTKTHLSMRQFLGITGLMVFISLALITALITNSRTAHAETVSGNLTTSELVTINHLNEVGQGSLLFNNEQRYRNAPILNTVVNMQVTGMINRVRLTQQFTNTTDQWQEGIYVFPLPENAAVDHMRIKVNERIIEGKIKERQEAKKVYQQAKQQGKRAALTEQQRPNIFTNSVVNIPPHESVEIQIEYQQVVNYDSGEFSLRFPMVVGPRYIPGTPVLFETNNVSEFNGNGWAQNTDQVPDASQITPPLLSEHSTRKNPVSITIALDAGLELEKIDSRYHQVDVIQQDSNHYIKLNNETTLANRDFELHWRPTTDNAPRAAFFTEQKDGEIYAMVMLLPPEAKQTNKLNREIIFVIDTSGSMGGQSILQAKSALSLALNRLHSGDTFNVIQFNSYTSALFSQPRRVNNANIDQALTYVASLQANGGTEMATAMNAALSNNANEKLLRQVIFMTDGSIGNEQALFNIIQNKLGNSRLFTVGIGSAPNSYFMRRAASFGKGTHTYIGDLTEVQTKMLALFEKIESPVLKDIHISWPATNTEMWPEKIVDLYQGEPLLVTAKLTQLPKQISISGQLANQAWNHQLKLNGGQQHSGIATLWARNKIASLMQQKGQPDFDKIKSQIIETALTHHLVSAYTSLIAVDVTPIRPENSKLDSKAIPTHLPEGWDRNKVFGQAYPATATDSRFYFLLALMLFLVYAVLRHSPARLSV